MILLYIFLICRNSRVVTCCDLLLLDVVHSTVLVRARPVKPVLCKGDLFFLLLCLFRHLALLKAWGGYHWATFSRSLILRPNSWPSTRSHNLLHLHNPFLLYGVEVCFFILIISQTVGEVVLNKRSTTFIILELEPSRFVI
jgi:hypothetical protein